MEFSLIDAGTFVTTLIASVGGGGFIIWKFSAFLGNHWAKELMQKKEYDYKANLESLKKEYELEFEQIKSKYFRYSEKQFVLYNDLWRSLMKLKISGDALYADASLENLQIFAAQLSETNDAILESALLIEDEHYSTLLDLLNKFSKYKLGKERLIDLRDKKIDPPDLETLLGEQVQILFNKKNRDAYAILLEEIRAVFKRQIRNA